jgi:hypothetical protein
VGNDLSDQLFVPVVMPVLAKELCYFSTTFPERDDVP